MEKDLVIDIKNLSKTFYISEKSNDTIRETVLNIFSRKTSKRKLQALDNIDLQVNRGDFIGLIGHNGSGKSTLLKIIIGAFMPNKGSIINTKGKITRLALGTGFDPNLSARDNIYLNGSILGLTFKEIGEQFENILEFAELKDFVDTPIKFFSSGMISRLSFSVAMYTKTDIFLIDEFFGGVGDISFQEKSGKVFKEAFLTGKTIIFVSHNLDLIREYCNKVYILKKGKFMMNGSPEEAINYYQTEFHNF